MVEWDSFPFVNLAFLHDEIHGLQNGEIGQWVACNGHIICSTTDGETAKHAPFAQHLNNQRCRRRDKDNYAKKARQWLYGRLNLLLEFNSIFSDPGNHIPSLTM